MNGSSSFTEQSLIYRFDDYTLDPQSRTLRHGQGIVELTPKLFHTLLTLVENHDRVMSKDELLGKIWPNQIVEESNITQNISVLRKVLGEADRKKKYIETFPGHGYRFSEPITVDLDSQPAHEVGFIARESPVADLPVSVSSSLSSGFSPILTAKHIILYYKGYFFTAILCFVVGVICSALFFDRRRVPQQQQPVLALAPSSQLKTLTGIGGSQSQPSWSHDGKQIAFVYTALNDSRSAIYIQSPDDIQPHRVVYGSGQYSSPVWSPDGKSLAYLHIQPDKVAIFILDVARSTSTRLTNLFPHRYSLNYRHLDWSPDGKMLVVDDKGAESDPLSLYLVSVSNGYKTRLTYPDMDMIGDVSPRFSPDGSQVAFIRIKYQFLNDIFLVPVTGGAEIRRLTDRSSLISDADWESNHSVIFSGRRNGSFRLWRLNLLLSHLHGVLASSISTDLPLQFSISRISQKVAFSAYRPNLNIWALKLSKTPHSRTDWIPIIRNSGENMSPSYSSDGTKISFRSDASGEMQIWVSRADGSDAWRVDTGNTIPAINCWAPDGNSIVFSARQSHGLYEVSLLHKLPLRHITSEFSDPFVSVDGKWIFARIHNFIYRMPATGGSGVQITNQGGAPLVQSKDGYYLYFSHGRMSSTISRLDLRAHHQEVVLDSLMPGYRDCWALTSKGIIFLTETSGRPMIAFHDFATGKERDIAEFIGDLPPVGMSGFTVSPDERYLMVVRAEPVSANIQIATF